MAWTRATIYFGGDWCSTLISMSLIAKYRPGGQRVAELSALRGVNMRVHTGVTAARESGVRLAVVFQSEGRDEGRISDAPLEIDGRKLRLLIVDDDALIAMDLSVSIGELGAQVVGVAVTALDAVRLAKELRPDVVLMDVRLRGNLDGIDAARAIRHDSSTPIVFVTGNADSRTMRRMTDVEGAQVILKPVLIDELHDAIIRAAGR
jgi:CheY-like chemotaxis protein